MRKPAASYTALAAATVVAFELVNGRAYTPLAISFAYSVTLAVVLAALAALWLYAPRLEAGRASPVNPPRALGVLVLGAGTYAVHARGILGPGPLWWLGAIAVAGLAVSAASLTPLVRDTSRIRLLLAGVVMTGLALRWFELEVTRIDPRRADMMPLVVVALREVGQGLPPYRTYHFPWDVPLTYLPLNWLAYGPAYFAGFDLRWTNMLAELSILGALFFVARRRKDKSLRDVAATLWAVWFVGHILIATDGQIAAAVQWAALAWVVALVIETNRWTPVAVGAAIATTPLVLPLLPTLAIAWHRGRTTAFAKPAKQPRRRRPLWQVVAMAAAVAALLILPWLLWSPNGFIDGTVLWFNDLDHYPRAKWNEAKAWAYYPGFAAVFWTLGLERLLKPIQVLLVGACAFLFWRDVNRQPLRRVLGPQLVGVAMVFLLFNPVMWGYLWGAVVAIALVATASLAPRA